MCSIRTTRNISCCILILILLPTQSVLAATGTDYDLVYYILENMPRGMSIVSNFRCEIREFIRDYSLERSGVYRNPREGHDDLHYDMCIRQLSFDDQGYGRMELSQGFRDKEDQLQTITYKSIVTWDGSKSILYEPRSGDSAPRARVASEPLGDLDVYADLMTSYTDELRSHLTRIIEENDKVRVVKNRQGCLRLSFSIPGGQRCTAVVDPNQGFSVIERRYYMVGGPEDKVYVQYKQIRRGLWFPVMIQIRKSTSLIPQSTRTLTVSQIQINDPNIYSDLFQIDFEVGTHVYDGVQNREYYTWAE